jgi:hypothetical protein
VRPRIPIGLVGLGWMGQVRSGRYRRIRMLFPERAGEPEGTGDPAGCGGDRFTDHDGIVPRMASREAVVPPAVPEAVG